jgi:hypothetical protein
MVQTHRVFFSVALTLPIAVGIGALGQNLAEWGFGRTKVYVSIDREHVTRGNALWKLGTSSATSKTQDAAFRAAAEEYRGAFESDVVSAYPGVSAIHKLWGDALWNLAHEKGLEWHVVSEALLEAEKEYEFQVTYDKENPLGYANLGTVRNRIGTYDEALETLLKGTRVAGFVKATSGLRGWMFEEIAAAHELSGHKVDAETFRTKAYAEGENFRTHYIRNVLPECRANDAHRKK